VLAIVFSTIEARLSPHVRIFGVSPGFGAALTVSVAIYEGAAGGAFFGLACGVVGVLLMWFMPSLLIVLLVGAFLFGVVYAMTTVQTPLLVRSVFGSADYTNIYSRISMVGSLMSAVAAVFWSFVIDSPGGFPAMFIGGLACMAVCLVTSLFALGQKVEA